MNKSSTLSPSQPEEVPEAVLDAVAEALGSGAYDCTRVWGAWQVNTMGPEDFSPIAEDGDRVAEIALAAITAHRMISAENLWENFVESVRVDAGAKEVKNIIGGVKKLKAMFLAAALESKAEIPIQPGCEIIEKAMEKAALIDPKNSPHPMSGEFARAYQLGLRDAYRHALEVLGIPKD